MCHGTSTSGGCVCPNKKLNQVTFPFTSPILICGDAVQEIDTEVNCFIGVDMDSGYWKVMA